MARLSVALLVASLTTVGCSSTGGNRVGSGIGSDYTPVIDTKGLDQGQYLVDLQECRQLANQVEENRKGEIVGKAIGGALVGALIVSSGGDSGRQSGAKAGLAIGAAGGASNAFSGGKVVIKRCLQGRGYVVLE